MDGESETKSNYSELIASVRDAFNSGKTKLMSFRIEQLKKLRNLLRENENKFVDAMAKDMHKPLLEATLYDFEVVLNEVDSFIRNMGKWAKDEKLPANLIVMMDSGYIRKEPYGVVLILGPWNYPIQLTLLPLVGAIAAGNCVVVKPSEMAPHCAQLVAHLIPKYLDKECYRVVLAEVEGTKELMSHKWDYIFFTGSPAVGRAVMAAAAPNLTPVTLELGGKSPCYIDDSANFEIATKRIIWGKCVNLGQICVAPDYVLCSKYAEMAFLQVARELLKEWYGDDLQKSSDISRIINKRHCSRLRNLLKTTRGKIVLGGGSDKNDLWIEPTIVTKVALDDPIMQDEIFGPILPIITVKSLDEAVDLINKGPKPLAIYAFSQNEAVNMALIESTSSGSVCLNDTIFQAAWHGLPFGGVGDSGMGNYHGKQSFDTFSHHKSVLNRACSKFNEKLVGARYPPYSIDKVRFMQSIMRNMEYFDLTCGNYLSHFAALILGAGMFALFAYIYGLVF